MGPSLRHRRWFRTLAHVCRVIFALTFIASGFFKAIDPFGTALNIQNYLDVYHWSLPEWLVAGLSIWLCGAELMMGCMLLFKVRIRLISIFAVLSMTIFTIITLLSATVLPVEDCGCFGEVVKLTPLQTFLKNLALLPMAFCFWWRYRPDRILSFSKIEMVLTVLFCTMSMGLSIYSYRHLPLIDLFPYKVGVNIAEAIDVAKNEKANEGIVLVYRHRKTGKLKEFSMNELAKLPDEAYWEHVETHSDIARSEQFKPMILEFSVSDAGGDKTHELLSHKGKVYMLCVTSLEDMPKRCEKRMGALIARAKEEGATVVCLMPCIVDTLCDRSFDGSDPVKCYTIDIRVLRSMLRAKYGLVELMDGTIVRKCNWRDI